MHTSTTNTKSLARLRRLASLAGAGIALSAGSLAVAAGAATAAPSATGSGSAAGIPFQCSLGGNTVVFTTTGGTFHEVNQMQQDANGVYHFTGTISLQSVTASDGDGNGYSIVGSSWYGGSGTSPATATVRSTDEFNVLGPQGLVAELHAEMTFNPDGSVRGTSFGDCAPPM